MEIRRATWFIIRLIFDSIHSFHSNYFFSYGINLLFKSYVIWHIKCLSSQKINLWEMFDMFKELLIWNIFESFLSICSISFHKKWDKFEKKILTMRNLNPCLVWEVINIISRKKKFHTLHNFLFKASKKVLTINAITFRTIWKENNYVCKHK